MNTASSVETVPVLTSRLVSAYAEWEEGEGTSPSARDLVFEAQQVMNVDLDFGVFLAVSGDFFEVQCESATVGEQAEWLFNRLRYERDVARQAAL